MKTKPGRNGAFTLLEMLTVIAIIAVLAGLLFPVIKGAMLRAEVAKAQQGVNSLATALRHYYTEYGKWPIVDSSASPPYEHFIVDATLVALLSGDDVGGLTSILYPPSGAPYYASKDNGTGPPYTQSGSGIIQGNTRKIVFLEFRKADIDPSKGYFVDPWGRPYHFCLDITYQNKVRSPYLPLNPRNFESPAGFLIWSVGPDGQYDRLDAVVSWPPLITTPSPANKDNVNSWQ